VNFQPLFAPKTVAVVGVSLSNDRHPANVIYQKNLLRYPVEVFPVNPRGGFLQGEPVYTGIGEIPKPLDLAVIAVRAPQVTEVVGACIRHGVGGAAVISGGFAESGQTERQERLAALARAADFPFVGPNCLGIYVPNQVDTFFLPTERMVRPEAGNVALISQSGGILVDQMVKFAEEGVGLSLAVSIGNKAVVRETDLLGYLAQDPATRVIAFYVEGFGRNEGREFVQAVGRCAKPVVVLKAGKSAGGSRAITSHTASLAGDYDVFAAVMAQFGVVEAQNEFELVSFCEALSCYQHANGGRIGIVTGSGGHGVLAVDACIAHGLEVPELSASVRDAIRPRLSGSIQAIAALGNPIDLTGSALDEDFVAAAAGLGAAPEIDCVIMLLLPYSPGITMDLGARLSQIARRSGKPLLAYVPHLEKYRMLIEGFELSRVPVSPSIDGAVLMAKALHRSRRKI
jgi:acyl-CoA synthetase (NDP forming)